MPSKDEIDNQVQNYIKKFGTKDKMEKFLMNRNLTVDNLRNEGTKNVIIGKMIKEVIPDLASRLKISGSEVKSYYEKSKSEFDGKPLSEVKDGSYIAV